VFVRHSSPHSNYGGYDCKPDATTRHRRGKITDGQSNGPMVVAPPSATSVPGRPLVQSIERLAAAFAIAVVDLGKMHKS
jgi:hypothetical protein